MDSRMVRTCSKGAVQRSSAEVQCRGAGERCSVEEQCRGAVQFSAAVCRAKMQLRRAAKSSRGEVFRRCSAEYTVPRRGSKWTI